MPSYVPNNYLLKSVFFAIVQKPYCVYSSVVERCPDKTEVLGSIPSTRT